MACKTSLPQAMLIRNLGLRDCKKRKLKDIQPRQAWYLFVTSSYSLKAETLCQ